MNCPKCGAYNYDTRTTCVLCGAVLGTPDKPEEATVIQPPSEPLPLGSQPTIAVPPPQPALQRDYSTPSTPPPPVLTGPQSQTPAYPLLTATNTSYTQAGAKSNSLLITCSIALAVLLCLALLAGGGGALLMYKSAQNALGTTTAQAVYDQSTQVALAAFEQSTHEARLTQSAEQTAAAAAAKTARATQSAQETAVAQITQIYEATQSVQETRVAAATQVIETAHALLPSNYTALLKEPFDNNNEKWETGAETNDFWKGSRTIADGSYTWETFGIQGFSTWEQYTFEQVTRSFYLTVQANKLQGNDESCYGLAFRGSDSQHYIYEVCDATQEYYVSVYTKDWTNLIESTYSSYINKSLPNRMAILATGSHYIFIINGHNVAELDDSTLTTGSMGMVMEAAEGDSATVQFDNFEVWVP